MQKQKEKEFHMKGTPKDLDKKLQNFPLWMTTINYEVVFLNFEFASNLDKKLVLCFITENWDLNYVFNK